MARPPIKAQELADALAAQICAGEYAPGSWLPSERQLAEANGVSRATTRQAAQILMEGGLIELVAGSGARVLAKTLRPAPGATKSVSEEIAAMRRLLQEFDARLAAIEDRLG